MADDAPLWGGRFRAPVHPEIHRFTSSLAFDRRLAVHDIVASMAHARVLLEAGVLERRDARAVLTGLSDILRDLENEELAVGGDHEDVHSWLEEELAGRIGEPARRLHTGRSRNDQTAVALRLFLRARLRELLTELLQPTEIWLGGAERHRGSCMPGYTHLQRAQPITLGHHLLAHARALLADGRRLTDVHHEAGISPLGAAALAGSSHDIDPHRSAALLGLSGPYPNTMLAVSDRDYVASALFALSLVMIHLSRWSEEVILWCSSEFGFASLADEAAQGSSLMPQKRNPEAAEIVRGKAGRVVGDLSGFLTTLKGLPLAYASDLQEDKEPLFDALDTTSSSLRATAITARSLEFHTDRMEAALDEGHLTATELADHLVREGTPFREAHRQVGRAVLAAEHRQCRLSELPLELLRECCPEGDETVRETLDPRAAILRRSTPGGPAPDEIDRQVEAAREEVERLRRWRAGIDEPPIYRAHRRGRLLDDEIPAPENRYGPEAP